MRNKKYLTKKLIDLVPGENTPSVESILPVWWHNLRQNGGMRLTSTGYNVFVQILKIEHYKFNIDNPLIFNQQVILDLDRKLQMPYYIETIKGVPKKLVFFGSREAVMANLYGDLKKFLDNYKQL